MSHPTLGRSVACSVLLGLFLAACSDSNNPKDPPTLVATFEGVLGGDDGTESGIFNIDVLSDNTGSGDFTPTGSVGQSLNVLVTGNSFIATGGPVTVTGSITGDEMSGGYTKGAAAGLVAALKKIVGTTHVRFCAAHSGDDGDGVYAFVWDQSTHKLHGLWTTSGSAFRGIITGEDEIGGGAGATMTGNTGTVTILPDVGPPANVGGFYDLNGSTVGGTMSGAACP